METPGGSDREGSHARAHTQHLHASHEPSPRSAAFSSGDERFATPRASARSGGYASSSGDERELFYSARSDQDGRDDGEFFGRNRGGVGIHSSRSQSGDEWGTPRGIVPGGGAAGASGGGLAESKFDDPYYNRGSDARYAQQPQQQQQQQQQQYHHDSQVPMPYGGEDGGAVMPFTPNAGGAGAASSAQQHMHYTSEEHGHGQHHYAEHEYTQQPYQQQQQQHEHQVAQDMHTVEDIFSLARHGRTAEVEALLDRGIPVNVRDNHGNTLLSIACQNGLKRVAKLVLRRGADINAQNHKGNTPLHFCYTYGYGDTLGAYLTSKGADTTVRNHDGMTCYDQQQY